MPVVVRLSLNHQQGSSLSNKVTIEISDHVATVMLNRGEKRNAIDMAMFEELSQLGDSLKGDTNVRAVVLTGSGKHFCAGIDLSVFQGPGIDTAGRGKMNAYNDSPANFFQSAAYVWRELPVPVIAALSGSVFGAGLQIAMGADIRFASPDVRMSIMEVKWGLIPDMALSTTLRHVVPTDKIRELAYTGRVIDGTEAAAIGLVTAIKEDPLNVAQTAAAEIAGKSPDVIRALKRLINEAWEVDHASALRQEAELQIAIMAGDNQKEAVLANMEKREPDFSDPKV